MKIKELLEDASAGATSSGGIATAPAGAGYAGAPYGVGTKPGGTAKKKKNESEYENSAKKLEEFPIIRR